jgi:hypothetical protein
MNEPQPASTRSEVSIGRAALAPCAPLASETELLTLLMAVTPREDAEGMLPNAHYAYPELIDAFAELFAADGPRFPPCATDRLRRHVFDVVVINSHMPRPGDLRAARRSALANTIRLHMLAHAGDGHDPRLGDFLAAIAPFEPAIVLAAARFLIWHALAADGRTYFDDHHLAITCLFASLTRQAGSGAFRILCTRESESDLFQDVQGYHVWKENVSGPNGLLTILPALIRLPE